MDAYIVLEILRDKLQSRASLAGAAGTPNGDLRQRALEDVIDSITETMNELAARIPPRPSTREVW
jgi:hypothetical protein